MLAHIAIPLLVAVIGVLMYALCTSNPKLSQIGWALFCIGAFWTVAIVAHQSANVF